MLWATLPLSFFLLFAAAPCFSEDIQDQVHIVYLGEHNKKTRTIQAIEENHLSLLLSVKKSEDAARESLLYSYKNSINGFAAILSDEEAAKISEIEGVISAFPSKERVMHTTRSWEFITMEEGLSDADRESMPSRANYGRDVIVGMLDSGIWPESKSFDDKGMGPIPKKWKGVCEEGYAFNASSCNKKLIGARYYIKGYEAYYGPLNTTYSYRSPRDSDGHGTHTASTVGGRAVPGVSAIGGFAHGTASGGAPLARLAIYKVCWPIPGPNPNLENTCFDADMLAAFDDAIKDGVDVISMSIGASGTPRKYSSDSMAIGALHAAKEDIVVACSGGNSGPELGTVVNLAPWTITVGASSIDRAFPSSVALGTGKKIEGQTVTPYRLKKGKMYPLVYAGNVEVPNLPRNISGQCLPNSLAPEKVAGKVVVCFRGAGFRVGKGLEVKRAGGAAIVLGNALANGNEIAVDAHVLPGVGVSYGDAIAIMSYINSTPEPTIAIGPAATDFNVRAAPVMAAFSSRGPNRVEPDILKPDITAPGLNILAAWSGSSAPTKVDGDPRRVKYNLISGTSMSCPHVGATAALLKSLYPNWSSAAIRSAMITTATRINMEGDPITTAAGEAAGPMDYGAGHIRSSLASDPGLVYDANYTDYLLFACSSIKVQMDPTFPCPANPPPPSDLNYPSVSVTGLRAAAVKVIRTVTNVGQRKARYKVEVEEPSGVKVGITPKVLRFRKVGEKKKFVIKLTAVGKGSTAGGHVGGSYTWSDGIHAVTSPIVVTLT
ncbi:subtilisin-like protease SBT5.6 isoform X1 [Iris pallida]|uniref:Subtilisin-like protease SBT5.6 isoform X1 n=1 Tax=Iris pallida TaxID=29817 RepID=A0AAX6GQ22_IRIPA|nr:subtilisin-like protease SBT5.6 isoform X1 [Iris pallida]